MGIYEVKYRRTIEGTMFVHASSDADAQKKVSIELACGSAPCTNITNEFLSTTMHVVSENKENM